MNDITVSSQKNASVFFDPNAFEQAQRVAKAFASSDLVPKNYQNQIGNCMIAFDLAQRLNVHPLMLMQNTYVVHGKPSFEGKFVISLLNGSGLLQNRLNWEFDDEINPTTCTCICVTKDGQEIKETLTWDDVIKFGWSKNNPWQTMRKQMFRYRTAVFLARAYFPDLLMGMQTKEEIIDVENLSTRPTLPRTQIQKSPIIEVPKKEKKKKKEVIEVPVFSISADLENREIVLSESGESIPISEYAVLELENIYATATQEKNENLRTLVMSEIQNKTSTKASELKKAKANK